MRIFRKGTYRLFKDDRPLKERMYYALGIAIPCDSINSDYTIVNGIKKSIIKVYTAEHTEMENTEYSIFLLEDGTYVSPLLSEPHVLYKALYGEEIYYIRPYGMFMSLADKKKYPQFKQKYRFEYLEDDYRYKHVEWGFEKVDLDLTKKYLESNEIDFCNIGSLYIGELKIDITLVKNKNNITLQYEVYVGNEETGFGVTYQGMFYDYAEGGIIDDFTLNDSFEDVQKKILNHAYDYIEAYETDLLREKAISNREVNW